MRYRMLAALALFAVVSPAQAQTPALMTSWTIEDMRSVITEQGAKVTESGVSASGEAYVKGTADTGLHFSVYGAECDSKEVTQHCTGAEMSTSFTIKSGQLDKALADIDYAAVGYYGSDGDVHVTRYVIFDNGITRENLKVNFRVFLNISGKIWDMLSTKGYMD